MLLPARLSKKAQAFRFLLKKYMLHLHITLQFTNDNTAIR